MESHFSFGLLSFLAPLALVGAYIVGLGVRHATAWLHRSTPPRERVVPVMLLVATIGFVGGSAMQPMYEKARDCAAAGQAPIPCALNMTGRS